MTNGVRQGAILSAIAYCFYCEELFSLLKSRRAGCWVLNNYHGIFGYSDGNWFVRVDEKELNKKTTEYKMGCSPIN